MVCVGDNVFSANALLAVMFVDELMVAATTTAAMCGGGGSKGKDD